MDVQYLTKNLADLEQCIQNTCLKTGRSPQQIRLIPVTKTKPLETIQNAIDLGVTRFGENKVQELISKAEQLKSEKVNWILIGHLQTNKVKQIVQYISEFHALDSIRLANKLNNELSAIDKKLDVFIQVNTSNEASKYGIQPHELTDFLAEVEKLDHLNIVGLMTLAIHSHEEQKVRSCFRTLKELLIETQASYPEISRLSMGMSGDFEIAIEEGATDIRVGQAIFGHRNLPDSYYWPE
ncbi:YggS family pyridoxal phosphate-dependent enzyme [Acinetobacter rongchengensis]|uniref:Pyridoxal phosphate homeostasis protein n=1 Tax=Acinetobacter rongchengensis TaxID=2419601 RepID=A0A3A8F522_9GAMM|nr:YggS family pyridoxal phosphate-dependent enzyme [Acinetobacter rongchengensis]RKG37454.1 YggS family pyridoxal phosphate-dependent enzyme [Acinetobacter rongchengensis]